MKLFDCLRLSAWMTLVSAFFVFSACNGVIEKDDVISNDNKEKVEPVSSDPSVTVGAEKVSAVSAVLKGKANIGSSVAADLEMGILYSLNEGVIASNSTRVKASNMDGDFNYSVNVTLLDPATTYYFRSYVTQNGQDTYGETKSFTTKELSSMIHTEDASNISAVSAILNGSYDLTDVQYTTKKIGLFYGTSAESLSENCIAGISSISGDFSEKWPVLKPATEYYYQVYINLDNKLYKEEIVSFTTKELSSMLETKDATDIAPTSAKMNAKLDLTNVQRTTMEYGFYWGTSESSQTTYVKGGDVAGNAYSASLSGLSHKTQYWYKAYLKVDGQQFYGMVKTFTTEVVPVTSVSLNKNDYTFNTIGNTFTLTPTVLPSDATNKVVSWESSKTSVATVDANGNVTAKGNGSATITVTTKDQSKKATCTITVAQWVTGITLNKTSLLLEKGKAATLTATVTPSNANDKTVTWSSSNTSVATVSSSGVVTGVAGGTTTITATAKDGSGKKATCSVFVPTDLSSSKSANCYIVSSAGGYKFKTVQGNSATSVGSVSKAEVLWESFGTSTAPSKGDIISTVSYSGNYITFATPSTLKNGNAVIAAKDASGNILWSWHIWVCSGYNPTSTAQTYKNSAGKMMDRNLGATSASVGNVGSLGLLYQWGRKDPFLGGCWISYSSSSNQLQKAASTLTWPSDVWSTSSNGKVAYAVKNPTTFITGGSGTDYDWVYSSRDNTLWQTSKTIYDPCPPGWKVPAGGDSGVWSKALGSSDSFDYTWNSTSKGMNFSGKFGSASTIWYPAAGYLEYDDGCLYNVGYFGFWWSCTPNGRIGAYRLRIEGRRVTPSDYSGSRANGQSVRCVQE